MPKRGRRKVKKRATTRSKKKALAGMPKPIRKVVEKLAEKPEDVEVIHPTPSDPVVRVKGKVVGSWISL